MSNFTQNVLLDTFGRFLEEDTFDKITVSDIIKESNVSRNTFYYHYKDIYALLDRWLEQQLSNFEFQPEKDNWLDELKAVFYKCVDNKKIISHLLDSRARDHVEHFVYCYTGSAAYKYAASQLEVKGVSPRRINAVADIIRYAVIGYFLRFYWDGMTGDIDKSVEQLGEMFEAIIAQQLK
jgi:AcrR family transcriptional regulator